MASAEDLEGPESREVAAADLGESMNQLKLIPSSVNDSKPRKLADDAPPHFPSSSSSDKVSDDAINQVDQFLREAIQNPRERLSILRIEQDVEKFIHDPNEQKLEFQQLPTSYLRLAAHRVAQHYSLQSMVLLDDSLPDGSGSKIIVCKSVGCKPPLIRLADIPVKLSSEGNAFPKVAIKQRPKKQSQVLSNSSSNSAKNRDSKSVEERKEEYNKARARIFSSSNNGGGSVGGKPECESRKQKNNYLLGSLGVSSVEDKSLSVSDVSSSWMLVESSANNIRDRSRMDESVGRHKQSSRVAIFRDREVDCKDPDYDRSYENRYIQRFDHGFGFNGGLYTMQPMHTAVLNCNTEFPQLGSTHGMQLPTQHQPQPFPHHIPGPWAPPTPAVMGYGHPKTMLAPFNSRHVGTCSAPTLYLHPSPYSCHCPGIPFSPQEHVHQSFAQFHQPAPNASFGMAWPR